MKYSIELSYFDFIEGFSAKKLFPIIFETKEKAEIAHDMIKRHNDAVVFTLQDEIMRKVSNEKRIEKLYFDIEKEDWLVSAPESIEYDLIYLKDNEKYSELFEGYIKEYKKYKENSPYDYLCRSLSYIKIQNRIIIA